MGCRSSESSVTVETHCSTDRITQHPAGQTQLTIDTLPDDALLYVFDFYVAQASEVEAWHTLVHVCRRWRNIVFGSPRRLNLRIACTEESPVREKLDIWPPLPIVISPRFKSTTDLDNIRAALEHHDRVCRIKIFFLGTDFELEYLTALLEEPFPILTDLYLEAFAYFGPFDPDPSKFLGGSTYLRSLTLSNIRIPESLNLLLCTPNLVILRLVRVPASVRSSFQPEAMVTVLSALTRLEQLEVEFRPYHPTSKLENRHLPLLTRTVLPSLTILKVRGTTEAMDDFMARIDSPLLDRLHVLFQCYHFPDIVLDARQLPWFIRRIPKLQAPSEAHIGFATMQSANDFFNVWIEFLWPTQISSVVKLEIFCGHSEQKIPRLDQLCCSPFSPLPTLEHLYIARGQSLPPRPHLNNVENTRWLELLRPFTAVKNMYLTKEFAPCIALALQELVGDGVTEVLPTLQNIFIEELRPSGIVHEAITQFAATRQLSGHPMAIFHWDGTVEHKAWNFVVSL